MVTTKHRESDVTRQFDRSRFKEVLLYIAQSSENDPRFGATKLNKILYFSDFKAFATLGDFITGATYQRLDRGPAPHELRLLNASQVSALSHLEIGGGQLTGDREDIPYETAHFSDREATPTELAIRQAEVSRCRAQRES
ncbi:MAG: DUF4065 domain-containing protein [Chloroflexi bacterium]|nr:DUF4065 domain-containing protein [Chloroflexota bacterium]